MQIFTLRHCCWGKGQLVCWPPHCCTNKYVHQETRLPVRPTVWPTVRLMVELAVGLKVWLTVWLMVWLTVYSVLVFYGISQLLLLPELKILWQEKSFLQNYKSKHVQYRHCKKHGWACLSSGEWLNSLRTTVRRPEITWVVRLMPFEGG